MRNLKLIFILLLFFSLQGCQNLNEKANEILKKENEKLSKFIGKPLSNIEKALGEPDYIEKGDKGNKVIVYETKKYGISCQRKFEINNNKIVIGFISKGGF